MSTHRAREHLMRFREQAPKAFDFLDECHRDKGKPPLPDWPAWCYAPVAGGVTAAQRTGLGTMHAGALTALAAWRITQGIYRIDPALYGPLVETPIDGDIPADALLMLPEWCVYVETPGAVSYGNIPVLGAFCSLEFDVKTGGRELRLLLDVNGASGPDLVPCIVHLGGSVEDGIQAAAVTMIRNTGGVDVGQSLAARLWIDPARRIISLLLYICSLNDFSRRGNPGQPSNPEPKRTRRDGWKLFPASGPTEWVVGVRMGAALRAAYQREEAGQDGTPSGKQVRPHVRRAHWHTILSGPRKLANGTEVPADQRRRDLRWMPPIPVNIDDLDAIPAVIRPVK